MADYCGIWLVMTVRGKSQIVLSHCFCWEHPVRSLRTFPSILAGSTTQSGRVNFDVNAPWRSKALISMTGRGSTAECGVSSWTFLRHCSRLSLMSRISEHRRLLPTIARIFSWTSTTSSQVFRTTRTVRLESSRPLLQASTR
jgi:hypothetical protein